MEPGPFCTPPARACEACKACKACKCCNLGSNQGPRARALGAGWLRPAFAGVPLVGPHRSLPQRAINEKILQAGPRLAEGGDTLARAGPLEGGWDGGRRSIMGSTEHRADAHRDLGRNPHPRGHPGLPGFLGFLLDPDGPGPFLPAAPFLLANCVDDPTASSFERACTFQLPGQLQVSRLPFCLRLSRSASQRSSAAQCRAARRGSHRFLSTPRVAQLRSRQPCRTTDSISALAPDTTTFRQVRCV